MAAAILVCRIAAGATVTVRTADQGCAAATLLPVLSCSGTCPEPAAAVALDASKPVDLRLEVPGYAPAYVFDVAATGGETAAPETESGH